MSNPNPISHRIRGWRGVCLIAIVYVYFLIFAQFAYLNRLVQLGIADASLQRVMAAMALGGIGFSLLAAHRLVRSRPRAGLLLGLTVCAVAALCTALTLQQWSSMAVAFLIGAGLGLLTVTLVANLRLWIGPGNAVLRVGLGTGLGYLLCNVPALFDATPTTQAIVAAALCALGILAGSKVEPAAQPANEPAPPAGTPFLYVLIAFTALVWLDSAAFFIIQNTPSLKAGTWGGALHLWSNALIHLAAALLSGLLLSRRGLREVLVLAVLALSVACLLLHDPAQASLASLFYPAGVSLYSVALVAYPSLLAPAGSTQRRALQAAVIYAVAGWMGSALGIGMAQHLRQVPVAFLAAALAAVVGPAILLAAPERRREAGLASVALLAALGLGRLIPDKPAPATEVERGRQVYIAEGCISCHSQYVRPHTADVSLWGPPETVAELRAQHPPLIGNRRQGPDLSQTGGRRSPLWLKAHLIDPRELSDASFMPSYGYLFQNSTRGEDLVAYLASLKSPAYAVQVAFEQTWQPAASSTSADAGPQLYSRHCATCHENAGATRSTWATGFRRLPPDLHAGPFLHLPAAGTSAQRTLSLARIVKFGIPGTDMPGHEYLTDHDITALALWLDRTLAPASQLTRMAYPSGGSR